MTRLDLRPIGVALSGERGSPTIALALLSAMMLAELPQLRGAVALIDSPRWPCDMDYSRPHAGPRDHRGRELDGAVRALAVKLGSRSGSRLAPLSMFPTPPLNYFGAQLSAPGCKAHLRAMGRALFGRLLERDFGPPAGGLFTRFMIAGFAVYRALNALGADTYECYPDLQFRLWSGRLKLAAKNSSGGQGQGRAAALAGRRRVLQELAQSLGLEPFPVIRTLDEADAAVLVLTQAAARRDGATMVLEKRSEGRFLVALDAVDAQQLSASDSVSLQTVSSSR